MEAMEGDGLGDDGVTGTFAYPGLPL